MSNEDEKWKNTLMWIASVAVSVLCCSAIFVVFASYLADIKNDLHENNARLMLIEKRQDAIFAEFDFIHKHVAGGTLSADGQTAPIPAPLTGLTQFPTTPPPVMDPTPSAPVTSPTAAAPPAVPAPTPVSPTVAPDAAMSPNSAPAVTPPTVTVPTMPAMPDKK